jgi:pimeloyl-ACP methyl ester carboxylesterase
VQTAAGDVAVIIAKAAQRIDSQGKRIYKKTHCQASEQSRRLDRTNLSRRCYNRRNQIRRPTMNTRISTLLFTTLAAFSLISASPKLAVQEDKNITSHFAELPDGRIHYLRAGSGPLLVLLHGYTEDCTMWKPFIPRVASKFTVIAPDLPGIGDSSIPTSGSNMKVAATRIHALVQSLGFTQAEVVGHDIGLMVAYAYAAQFPSETRKLAVMDAFLPGVGDWRSYYNDPAMWHFRFNGPTPEALVEGRERIYFDHFWNDFAADKSHSVSDTDRNRYTACYSRPNRMRAGWSYFVSFPQTAEDFSVLSKTKLTMPVLSISGDHSGGSFLPTQMMLVAENVSQVIVPNSGHWLMEEHPAETFRALLEFL